MPTGLSRYRYLSCLGTTALVLLVKKCSTVETITGWRVKSGPDASPLDVSGFGTIKVIHDVQQPIFYLITQYNTTRGRSALLP